MADIKLADLAGHNISGIDLFNDSENFTIELSDDSEYILGGRPMEYTTIRCNDTCYKKTDVATHCFGSVVHY